MVSILCSVLIFVSLVNANICYDLSNEESDQGYGKPQRKNSVIVDSDINSASFTGKVVLVTGSTKHIGQNVARWFSKLGARVVVTGPNSKEVTRVAQSLQALSPQNLKALGVVADPANAEDMSKLIDQTINKFGKLDVLVNNANNFVPTGIKDTDFITNYDNIFNVNLRSVTILNKLSVKHLQQTNGTIIHISSIAGTSPLLDFLPFSMAKSALNMMTKSLALELGPLGIRANTVSPGISFIKVTGSNANVEINNLNQKQFQQTISNITPLKSSQSIGKVADISKIVAFLASGGNWFINGANLVIDGGVQFTLGAFNTMNREGKIQYIYDLDYDSEDTKL